MKKFKHFASILVLGGALASGGTAQAAISTATGELFISVVDRFGQQKNVVIDTGWKMDDIINGLAPTSLDLSTNTQYQNLIAGAANPSDITWNAGAFVVLRNEFLYTTPVPNPVVFARTIPLTAQTGVGHVQNVNFTDLNDALNVTKTLFPADPGYHDRQWGNNLGATVGGAASNIDTTEVILGQAMNLYDEGLHGRIRFQKDLGKYQLTSTGFSKVSAVPVPAAVWLFGSALMGLFSVNRRKKA